MLLLVLLQHLQRQVVQAAVLFLKHLQHDCLTRAQLLMLCLQLLNLHESRIERIS
jgi:hypothetical protein